VPKIPLYPSSVAPNDDDLLILEDSVTSNTKKIKRSDLLGGNTITATNDIATDAITGITDADSGDIYGITVTNGKMSGDDLTDASVPIAKLTNPYKFSAYLGSAQNSSSGFTKVALKSETFDTNNNFDAVTNYRYVAPVAGYYQFTGAVASTNGATPGGVWEAFLYKNNNQAKAGTNARSTATYQNSTVSGLIYLAVNDYIELFIYAADAVPILTGATNTYLDGHLVSV